jgi:fluoroacetyl-CoA thioesterase
VKPSLAVGLVHEFAYRVPPEKTVAHLFREAPEFQAMPEVFATGYLVGLVEWTCIQALLPHLDWPREQSLGTHVSLSHSAPTPPGRTVTVRVTLSRVEGRRLWFDVQARDDANLVSEGTHERVVVDAERFRQRLAGSLPG